MVKRYVVATVFVDHYYDFTYIHLISKLDAGSTVKSRMEFERICDSCGVKVLHYNADNGRFDTKNFKEACNTAKQTLSFCGINAHHHNVKYEYRIKDVTTGSRTALLYAVHRWTNSIHTSFSFSGINNYANLRNSITDNYKPKNYHGMNKISSTYDSSSLSILSGSKVKSNLDHFH